MANEPVAVPQAGDERLVTALRDIERRLMPISDGYARDVIQYIRNVLSDTAEAQAGGAAVPQAGYFQEAHECPWCLRVTGLRILPAPSTVEVCGTCYGAFEQGREHERRAAQAGGGDERLKESLRARRFHQYDGGIHRFPSGGRAPCTGCLAMHLLGVYRQAEYEPYTPQAGGGLREALDDLLPLIGGWRELIAMLDDMQKDEAVGKAMWAALDQIDETRARLRALVATPQGEKE